MSSLSPTNIRAPDVLLNSSISFAQGLVWVLLSAKWQKQQDAICELSRHGLVFILEEINCLHSKVYLRKELFSSYEFSPVRRERFCINLSLLIDCISAFSMSNENTSLVMSYPGKEMELILRLTDSTNCFTDAEIRTKVVETLPREYSLQEPLEGASNPTVLSQTQALKEAIDDLEWPGTSVSISVSLDPPMATFFSEGHGDLQIDFPHDNKNDLFIDFSCEEPFKFRYKYKFLKATTVNIPNSLLRENRGTKFTFDKNGLLRVQHVFSLSRHLQDGFVENDPVNATKQSYVEFFVLPEELGDDSDAE